MEDTTIKNNPNLTYKAPITREERNNVIISFLLPVCVFALVIFTIVFLSNFGRITVTPFVSMMWITGLICAGILPSYRSTIIKELMIGIISYCGILLLFKLIITVLSGVNAATLSSSLNITMPETSGNTAIGYLQNIFLVMAWSVPLGFMVYQAQRAIKLKRTSDVSKALKKARSIRDTNKNFQ